MATMKDVARLAGVSHGTVSNVLNGSKCVSIDKIRKVEEAVKALGYKPNALARNLKTSYTGRIDVVLSNITEPAHAKLYDAVNRRAAAQGYSVYLQVTEDDPGVERETLDRALMYNSDGVILMTCQPENAEFFTKAVENGLNLVFIHRALNSNAFNFVCMDVKAAIGKSIEATVARGKRRIAIVTGPKEFSFEAECLESYFNALHKAKMDIRSSYVEAVNANKESAMRAAIRLMNAPEPPEVIYVSGRRLADGVLRALEVAEGDAKPEVIAFDAEDWTRSECDGGVLLPYASMGEAAFDLLDEIIKEGQDKGGRRIVIWGKAEKRAALPPLARLEGGRIRVLLQDAPSSASVLSLVSDFKKRTGIDVAFTLRPYRDMLNEIQRGVPSGAYDVFTFDLAWYKELMLGGYAQELTGLLPDNGALSHMFSEDVLREHCYFKDRLYALPFSHTAQLLFYRKDLFEKLKFQRMYFEWCKEDLAVPRTWEEYNRVARFFTRRFNPESPTLYGTTLGAMNSSGAVCEFLPRAWAQGGNVFENGVSTINSENCVAALTGYAESFRYAHPNSPDMWWDEQVEVFAKGDAAMMVMYSDHTTLLDDRSLSKVVGRVGFDLLPDGCSVLGGWSIGVSPRSEHKPEAAEFLKWVSSEEMAVPNAVMGRLVPYRSVYKNSEFGTFCPWYLKAIEAFNQARRRSMPKNSRGEGVSEAILESIIGEAVHGTVAGKCGAEQALREAAQRLDAAIR
ncbi:MAG TPA: extracellular solute-binding protein [Feifaniaceae bacterium]|nr:extracellular solute-binding protein [Feifaniaceae bacterium]